MVGVRLVVRVRASDANGASLGGVRVTARGTGVRTLAVTSGGGDARLVLTPRRAGVITVRAGGCTQRIAVAGRRGAPRLAG